MARHGSFLPDQNPFLRDVALWRAWKDGLSVVQIKACWLKELVEIAPVAIYPGWSLVGEHLPGLQFGFQSKKTSRKASRYLRKLGLPATVVREVRDCVCRWLNGFPLYAVGELDLEKSRGGGGWGQGRDQKGVTAMLNSLARLPHHRAAGASAAIIDLDPKFLHGLEGLERLVALLQASVRMGVGQLQLNVVTAERLRQAQQDPEHHGNIAVRVAGYSQMFKLIDKPMQNHIIARTKHQS
ncbi:MAG TPA: glycine radical domain-containing protein [bacterium]|nr:glycine radical domain-containing protein [bacterium]